MRFTALPTLGRLILSLIRRLKMLTPRLERDESRQGFDPLSPNGSNIMGLDQ
jgi:hypothetical protein